MSEPQHITNLRNRRKPANEQDACRQVIEIHLIDFLQLENGIHILEKHEMDVLVFSTQQNESSARRLCPTVLASSHIIISRPAW